MPAHAKQGITVMSHKDDKKRNTIVLIKRTGYNNVWINGVHYYYNQYEKLEDIADADFTKLAQQAEQNNKQLIIIRRK